MFCHALPLQPDLENTTKPHATMRRILLIALVSVGVVSLVSVTTAADRDDWHLEYGPAKPISFTCAVHLFAPQANIPEYIAFAAIPPDFGHQHPGRSAF